MNSGRKAAIPHDTPASPPTAVGMPLRAVVQKYADRCFQDTDGVTRDAARMLQIMDGWRPHQTDRAAGVRRNSAFDPDLSVIVVDGSRICHGEGAVSSGETKLLYTIVPRTQR